MEGFDGKTAIVTGGASGIGRGLCIALGDLGAVVVVADIDQAGALSTAKAITQNGGTARSVLLDVTDETAVTSVYRETTAKHGRLDYVFNNAGVGVAGDARDLETDLWRRVVDVDLWGAIHCTRAAYAIMTEQGHGHIVNTGSLSGVFAGPCQLPYVTSKHAVVGLSRALRIEGRELGVRVSVVCPGFVQSNIYDAASVINAPREAVRKAMKVPTRLLTPERSAALILKGVARNREVIVFPTLARLLWWLNRISSRLTDPVSAKIINDFREIRTPTGSGE